MRRGEPFDCEYFNDSKEVFPTCVGVNRKNWSDSADQFHEWRNNAVRDYPGTDALGGGDEIVEEFSEGLDEIDEVVAEEGEGAVDELEGRDEEGTNGSPVTNV